MNNGDKFVAELDIKDYFDCITHERLMEIVRSYISDERVLGLIRQFVNCRIEQEGHFADKTVGIVQGNPISPILSNMYLHALDQYMEQKEYHWVRFSDDLNIYAKTQAEAEAAYEDVVAFLRDICKLAVSEKKSGVFPVTGRIFLGYDYGLKAQGA